MDDQLKVLMVVLVQQEKQLGSKANTKFCLSWQYNRNESYLYLNKTDIYKFITKTNISWYNICLVKVSKDFAKDEQSKFIQTRQCMIFLLIIVQLKKVDYYY